MLSRERRASRRAAAMGLALGLGLAATACLVAGCGEFPFQVGDSQKPIGSATQVIPATEPSAVLSNLVFCFNDQKASMFLDQLTEDFVFIADEIDVAALEQTYPGIFDGWTLDVESRVTQYMLDAGRCTFASLALSGEVQLEQPTDSTYSGQLNYAIALLLNADSQTYMGKARLFMRKSSDNLWRIYRWEDIRPQDAQFDTWGILRGRIRATL
jgi:hypothetical protein